MNFLLNTFQKTGAACRPFALLALLWPFMLTSQLCAQSTYDLSFVTNGVNTTVTPELVHVNDDNTILYAWHSQISFPTSDSLCIALMSDSGTTIWAKQLGVDLHVFAAEQVAGGFELIGYEKANQSEGTYNDSYFKIDLDAQGSLLGMQFYDFTWGEQGRFAVRAPDGGWLMGGTSNVVFGAAQPQPMQLIRIDSNDVVMWHREFSYPFGNNPCLIANDALFESDGSAYIGGYLIDGFDTGILARVDNNGDLMWIYGGSFEQVYELERTSDDRTIAIATDAGEGIVFEFDSTGFPIAWQVYNVIAAGDPLVSNAAPTANGGLEFNLNSVFVEIDSTFNIVNQHTLNTNNFSVPRHCADFSANRVAASFTDNWTWTTNLLLLDATFDGQCSDGLYSITMGSGGGNISLLPVVDSIPSSVPVSPTVVSTTRTLETQLNCSPCNLDLAVTQQNVACNVDTSGWAAITPTGGTGAITYEWNSNSSLTDSILTNIGIGWYFATATDAAGCSATEHIIISSAPAWGISWSGSSNSTCSTNPNGVAVATPAGGVPPYTWQWANDSTITDSMQTGLAGGSYSVTITDSLGCHSSAGLFVASAAPDSGWTNAWNPTCSWTNSGAIAALTTFNNPPITYQWSHDPNLNNNQANNLVAGAYSVTVSNSVGCSVVLYDTLEIPGGPQVQLITANSTCAGQSNGTITALITSGVSPYQYSWSHDPNLGTIQATNLAPGPYSLTITDFNGCVTVVTDTVYEPDSLAASLVVAHPVCNGSADGTAMVAATGGTAPYTYSWSNDATNTSSSASGLAAGGICVTITDANLCTVVVCDTLIDPDTMALNVAASAPTCTGAADGTVTLTPLGGTPPFVYGLEAQTSLTPVFTGLTDGQYVVFVTDSNGCMAVDTAALSAPLPCDSVCPGDANKDGMVNHLDLLYVGFAQNETGPARTPQSIVWQYWPAYDWASTFPGGLNHKHADCDGNGMVEQADTLAIFDNYGKSHPGANPVPPIDPFSSDPQLSLVPNADSLEVGDTLKVDILLGSDSIPVDSVHGIAFTLLYDTALIDSANVRLAFVPSFLGDPGNTTITIKAHFHSLGYIEAAISRLDLINVSGNGKIAELWFDGIEDDLSGKGNGLMAANMVLRTDSIYLATSTEGFYAVQNDVDTIVVYATDSETAIASRQQHSTVTIVPNPATNLAAVRWTGTSFSRIVLTNVAGQVLQLQRPSHQSIVELDVSDLAPGLYFVRLEGAEGAVVKRLLVL